MGVDCGWWAWAKRKQHYLLIPHNGCHLAHQLWALIYSGICQLTMFSRLDDEPPRPLGHLESFEPCLGPHQLTSWLCKVGIGQKAKAPGGRDWICDSSFVFIVCHKQKLGAPINMHYIYSDTAIQRERGPLEQDIFYGLPDILWHQLWKIPHGFYWVDVIDFRWSGIVSASGCETGAPHGTRQKKCKISF